MDERREKAHDALDRLIDFIATLEAERDEAESEWAHTDDLRRAQIAKLTEELGISRQNEQAQSLYADAALARAERAEANERIQAEYARNAIARAEQAERERDEALRAVATLSLWSLPTFDPQDPQTEGEEMRLWAIRWLLEHGAPDAALSTEGEPAEDRCPTCGSASRRVFGVSYNPFAGEQMACGNPWHTTPKEDDPEFAISTEGDSDV
jgi:hypothetical protein